MLPYLSARNEPYPRVFVTNSSLAPQLPPPFVSQACRLNMARCKLETREYPSVVDICGQVLKESPHDLKALCVPPTLVFLVFVVLAAVCVARPPLPRAKFGIQLRA